MAGHQPRVPVRQQVVPVPRQHVPQVLHVWRRGLRGAGQLMKVCGDCGEAPARDQRPPNPGKKKDSRCNRCLRELARARRLREQYGWDTA